ncbi:MAG: alpha/beta hydrolase [Candidatus Eremiobacteraeota bacterium]|nr:alpha/beta hydrolase [Candidatus Eremiobacteraeota bacterium]
MDFSAAWSEFGDRTNPPILFLHGIRLGRDVWTEHARMLAPRFHVVTVDLPGHGVLEHVPFTQENVSSLLDRVVGDVLQAPPLIVGYSLGGFVTMRFAASRQERTAGLVLADCTLDFEGWKWWPYGATVTFTEHLPQPLYNALIHATLSLTLPQRWVELVESIPFNRQVFAQTSAIVREQKDALAEIATYRKPVLIVNGEYDFAFRSDERRYLHRLPQARLRLLRGADHVGPLLRAEEFAVIIVEFAQKVFGKA